MAGGRLVFFGERFVYLPPFVHQEPSQCTMTAAQMAANIAWLGDKTATQAEVRRLAAASGFATIPDDGYTTRNMITALGSHYELEVRHVGLSLEQWRDRLAHGWAGLLAVEYPKLPDDFRLDKNFTGGHRLLITGFNAATGQTLLLDPIKQEVDPDIDRIQIRKLYEAQGHFRDWQVWIREGQALNAGVRIERVLDDPVEVRIPEGRSCTFVHKRLPGLSADHTFDRAITVEVDRIGRRRKRSGEDGPAAPVYRIVGGDLPQLEGWWLDPPAGVDVLLTPPPVVPAGGGGDDADTRFQEGYLAGVAEERERWQAWLGDGPPTGDGMAGPALVDPGVGKGLG